MSEMSKAISSLDTEKQREYMRRIFSFNERYKNENGKSRRAFVLTLGCQQMRLIARE